MLTFEQWLAVENYDEPRLTPLMRKHLTAAWQADMRELEAKAEALVARAREPELWRYA